MFRREVIIPWRCPGLPHCLPVAPVLPPLSQLATRSPQIVRRVVARQIDAPTPRGTMFAIARSLLRHSLYRILSWLFPFGLPPFRPLIRAASDLAVDLMLPSSAAIALRLGLKSNLHLGHFMRRDAQKPSAQLPWRNQSCVLFRESFHSK
jgi:hypothetical protein